MPLHRLIFLNKFAKYFFRVHCIFLKVGQQAEPVPGAPADLWDQQQVRGVPGPQNEDHPRRNLVRKHGRTIW